LTQLFQNFLTLLNSTDMLNELKSNITAYSVNAEIMQAYETELQIPEGASASSVICVDIVSREQFANAIGDTRLQAIFVQNRNDVRPVNSGSFLTEGARDAFAALRGASLNNARLLRIVGPVQSAEDIKATGIEKGRVLPAQFNIDTHRAVKPFYKGQSPMVYPEASPNAGQTMTSGGQPLYEYSFLTVGVPTHTGFDLVVDRVATSVNVATSATTATTAEVQ
jgi:hypothetical protein